MDSIEASSNDQAIRLLARVLVLIVFLPSIGPTQSAAQSPLALRGGIGLSTTSYDQEIADHFNLASRGWGFQGTFAPRLYQYVGVLLEVGWEYWSQVCVGSPCEKDRSSTSSIMASTGIGLASPVLFVDDKSGPIGFGLTLNGGHEWIKSGLSQDNCLNCIIDDLNVNGGYWVEPGLDLYADPSVVIGFTYRIYESAADINSRITIRVIHR
jgi:hypothetical protein